MITELKRCLKKMDKRLDVFKQELKDLNTLKRKLIKQGVLYGTVHYKSGKYLRIIEPVKNGVKGKTIYIGANKEKQSKTLEAIERGKQLDQVEADLRELERNLDQFSRELHYASYAIE